MKNWIYGGIALLATSCSSPQEKQEVQQTPVLPSQHYTIEQFMDNASVSGGSFSHDESKILYSTDVSGIYNLYTIPVSGGEHTQITDSDSNSFFAISYFPKDDRMLFSSDDNGNEIYHIYLREEDGTIRDLTPGAEARSSFFGWSRDKNSFFFQSNKRDSRFMDVYEMELENLEAELIYENSENLQVSKISDDKNHLALVKPITTNDNNLYLYNRNTKEKTQLDQEQAGYTPVYFSRDNRSLFYTTDTGDEFAYLMRYDMETGEREKVAQEDWDIMYATLSESGRYRVIGINEDAKTVVKIQDLENDEPLEFPDVADGEIKSVRFSASEEKMLFYAGTSKSTSNMYAHDFNTGETTRLTNTMSPQIDLNDLVEGKVVRYPSFDGTEIPAIFYMPHQAIADSPVPAMVWVHGGPGGQSRLSYFPLIQYLANHGYAILAVNNRGSSGYGKTFFKMDDRQHGEGDLQDVIEGKNYLAGLPEIDSSKIGIIGGSYGGFMTMAAMTSAPTEFDVGVNLFGVTNWLRTLQSIPPWWESFKQALYEEMGDPATDSVRLHRISPLFHAEKIKRPLMVLQGATDPRVLQVESDEIVDAARQNDVPVEYVLFEDEGHGFVKKENQIEAYGKILTFLNTYLKGEEETAAGAKL
ncbi:MAG: alpha/beta fold hydrolase [Bacteroidia bacterium]